MPYIHIATSKTLSADEKRDFARARGQELIRLLEAFSLDSQVRSVRDTRL